jgi:hypothetical protein
MRSSQDASVSGGTCKKNVATLVRPGKGCKSQQKGPHFGALELREIG